MRNVSSIDPNPNPVRTRVATRVAIRFRLEPEPDNVSGSYKVWNPIDFISGSSSSLNLVRILASGFAKLEFRPDKKLESDPFADPVGIPGRQPWWSAQLSAILVP